MGSQVWNKRHPLWQYNSAKSPANQWKWWSQRNWCSKPHGKAALYDENYICHVNRNSGCHLAQCLLVGCATFSSGKRPLQIQGFHPSNPKKRLWVHAEWRGRIRVIKLNIGPMFPEFHWLILWYAPFEPKRRRPQTQVGEAKDFFQSVNRGLRLMVGSWTFTWSSPESWRSSARKARNSSSSSCAAIVHTSPNICNPPTTKNFTRNPPPKKMRVDRMHEFHALAGIPQCRRISRIG